jgi:hypothetical protein
MSDPNRKCCVYSATEESGHCEGAWFARGRCREHWIVLKKMSPGDQAQEIERAGMPARAKWQWAGNETELIEEQERLDAISGTSI